MNYRGHVASKTGSGYHSGIWWPFLLMYAIFNSLKFNNILIAYNFVHGSRFQKDIFIQIHEELSAYPPLYLKTF